MNILIAILAALIALGVILWIGLKVTPKPLPPLPARESGLENISLLDGLPGPVGRFYRTMYGDQIPVIESAIISGRAKMRMFGISLPGRFRFVHEAGKNYRHYIEVTWFGFPILKVNELYLDGNSRLELPFGVTENEPKINQAANLGLWAESVWLPSIFITDPRVSWEPVNDDTAMLRIPYGEELETFLVRFNPQTGLLSHTEAMRYKEATDETKTLWINEAIEWQILNGQLALTFGAVTWFGEGTAWAVFSVDEVVFNLDVSETVQRRGL